MPVIAVMNETTDTSDSEIAIWVNAIQQQLLQDVAPFWPEARDANLVFIPRGQQPPHFAWQTVLIDNADRANALGYHELTSFSQPLAKVFTAPTTAGGQTVSRVLSHEILEMVVNPNVMRRQQIGNDVYLVEVGDPVHLDHLGYMKQNVLVSNFVTPDYYGYTPGNRYDMRAIVPGPCPALIRGGVLCLLVNGQMQLRTADGSTAQENAAMAINPGSRRARWQAGHQTWRNSQPQNKVA